MVQISGLLWRRFRQAQRLQKCFKRQLSLANATESLGEARANLRINCSEQNPGNQCSKHVGEYYTIPKETVSTLFTHGFPKPAFLDEVRTLSECNVMIRKPAISILETMADESVARKIVVYGQDSCGKTMTLSHILHYCYLKNWLILFLPSVFKIVHSKQTVLPSPYKPARFDQPEEALSWLKTFQILNDKHLPQIMTTKEYKVGQKISIDVGSSISTVINQAFHRPNFATDAVGITVREVQRLSSEIPVLFAADEFNGLFWKTSLKNPETNDWLKPQDLSMVHHFRRLLKHNSQLERGRYVLALSRTGMERTFCSSYNHMQLLGSQGVSVVGSYEPIEVSEYDDNELLQCLKYYKHKGLFSRDFNHHQTLQEITYLTDRRPGLVQKMCLPF